MGVLRTPAFTNRPRTPWGQRVSPSVIGSNLTRIAGDQIFPDATEMPDRGMAPVLQIGRMSVPAEVEAEWNGWYNGEYIPGYRKVPGVIYARRYRVHEGTSAYTTVYEFANAAGVEASKSALIAAFAAHAGCDDPCSGIARRLYPDRSLRAHRETARMPIDSMEGPR